MAELAIVIPAYKIMYFDQALSSIANQTCKDFTLYIGDDSSPFEQLYEEASRAKSIWLPITSGFFDGSYDRFEKIVQRYSEILQGLHWL